jgi:hypothetical protein
VTPRILYGRQDQNKTRNPRRRNGERNLTYEEGPLKGQPFLPRHVHRDFFQLRHVKAMLQGAKFYFSGGVFGLTLFQLDLDAHNGETDLDLLLADMTGVFGRDYHLCASDRGHNLFFKLDYRGHSWKEANHFLGRLDRLVKAYAQKKGRASVPEVKGKPSADRSHFGTLAKLPRDFTEERLERFKALPVQSWAWLVALLERLEALVYDDQPAPEPEPAPATTEGDKPKRRRQSGSCLGVAVPEDQLERLPEAVRWYQANGMAIRVYALRPECGRQDITVTRQDCAELLGVMSLCGAHLKTEEFPQRFAMRVTMLAYERGLLQRGWNDSRWKVVRNAAKDCGYADVKSTEFWYDPLGEDKGRAMQWKLKPKFSFFERPQEVVGGGEEREGRIIAEGGDAQVPTPEYRPGLYRPVWRPMPGRDHMPDTEYREMEAQLGEFVQCAMPAYAYAGFCEPWQPRQGAEDDEDG